VNKEELTATAQAIPTPSADAAAEYEQKRETLVARVNELMLARSDLDTLVGPENHKMMTDNHANHARFVAAILSRMDANQLVDTVLWVFSAYRSHGFHKTYWAAQLNTWVEVLRGELSEEAFAGVYRLYDWFIIHQPSFFALTDEQIRTS
jgi:hypothetical protein